MTNLVVIQRFFPSFREGVFDNLAEQENTALICSAHQPGKIVHPDNLASKTYVHQLFSFLIGQNIVFFPWLFLELVKLKPKYIVTEGGSNTINNVAVWCYTKLFGAKYAVWDLGRAYKGKEKVSSLRRLYNCLYRKILSDAKYVYVYNSVGKSYFSSIVSPEKIINLRNTVDTNLISSLKKQNGIEEEVLIQKVSNFSQTILYVGAINEHKNLESLKDVLLGLNGGYCLIIVGGGIKQYIDKLRKYIGFENKVFFEGYKKLTELPPYYKVADFVILPGLGGLSINQAMAFGKPVVCSKADGGEKELVKNDETGFIYSNVAEAVAYINAQSPKSWVAMGRVAEELIYQNYSIDNMAQSLLTISRK